MRVLLDGSQRARRRIGRALLAGSILGWLLLLVQHHGFLRAGGAVVELCGGAETTFTWWRDPASLSRAAIDWAVMLVAMMTPTLIAPVIHVHERSFRHRQSLHVALFLLSYSTVWMLAGAVLIFAADTIRALSIDGPVPVIVATAAALLWQASPAKQRCLNRSHHHRALRAQGMAAALDVSRFGLQHATWCVGSCWLLMLVPLLLPHGHLGAMFAVGLLMVSERLERPRRPDWRLRGFTPLPRYLIEQFRLQREAPLHGLW